MDIKAYLPCKKPRRSNRLEVKEREEIKEKTIKEAPLGFFNILPLELKFVVLKYLTGGFDLLLNFLVIPSTYCPASQE